LSPQKSSKYIGGAGIVAAHASEMGAKVNFISVTGEDELHEWAKEKLISYKVNPFLLLDESRPTTLKQRFRAGSKTMLRVSHLRQHEVGLSIQEKMIEQVTSLLKEVNLIIFSDFSYGVLTKELVRKIIQLGKKKKIFMAADSQSSSQIGDISRFKNMNLITPTEHEARISTKNYEDGLVILSEEVKRQSQASNVLLKLGEEGLLINSDNRNFLTDKISALNTSPKDVSGAGDSLLITSALALACGGTIWEAAFMGSLAASIQVGRVGNTPLSSKELENNLK
jgi:rfaE bifunctional protein kinase chain/domain